MSMKPDHIQIGASIFIPSATIIVNAAPWRSGEINTDLPSGFSKSSHTDCPVWYTQWSSFTLKNVGGSIYFRQPICGGHGVVSGMGPCHGLDRLSPSHCLICWHPSLRKAVSFWEKMQTTHKKQYHIIQYYSCFECLQVIWVILLLCSHCGPFLSQSPCPQTSALEMPR